MKRDLLGDPGIRSLLKRANEADRALYAWVRDVLYPAQLERAGLSRADLERPAASGEPPLHRYRACRAYNNVVYKQALKARSIARTLTGRHSPAGASS